MVIPVVVISHEVHLIAVRVEVTLTCIPEVVGRNRAIECPLHIERAVALSLVATLVLSVEDVKIVTPYMHIIGIEADTILWVHHDSEVAQLHILTITYEYAVAVHCSVITHALNGEVHLLTLTLDLQTD